MIAQTVERPPLAKKLCEAGSLSVRTASSSLWPYSQKFACFRYSQQMLAALRSSAVEVSTPSTFSKRKMQLLKQIILAVKLPSSEAQATRQHLELKKLTVI